MFSAGLNLFIAVIIYETLVNIRDNNGSIVRDARNARILTMIIDGFPREEIARVCQVHRNTVYNWEKRLRGKLPELDELAKSSPQLLRTECLLLLHSKKHNRARTFSNHEIAEMTFIACQSPKAYGIELNQWSTRKLTRFIIDRGVVKSISHSQVHRILSSVGVKPHKHLYWLFSKDKTDKPDVFWKRIYEVNQLYALAELIRKYQGSEGGTHRHIVSTDEMTAIQALERVKVLCSPGLASRIEFEYVRHGVTSLTGFLDVVTGEVLTAYLNETRNEKDFVEALKQTISKDFDGEWTIILDNLNTHQSEELVRFIAEVCGPAECLRCINSIPELQDVELPESSKAFLDTADFDVADAFDEVSESIDLDRVDDQLFPSVTGDDAIFDTLEQDDTFSLLMEDGLDISPDDTPFSYTEIDPPASGRVILSDVPTMIAELRAMLSKAATMCADLITLVTSLKVMESAASIVADAAGAPSTAGATGGKDMIAIAGQIETRIGELTTMTADLARQADELNLRINREENHTMDEITAIQEEIKALTEKAKEIGKEGKEIGSDIEKLCPEGTTQSSKSKKTGKKGSKGKNDSPTPDEEVQNIAAEIAETARKIGNKARSIAGRLKNRATAVADAIEKETSAGDETATAKAEMTTSEAWKKHHLEAAKDETEEEKRARLRAAAKALLNEKFRLFTDKADVGYIPGNPISASRYCPSAEKEPKDPWPFVPQEIRDFFLSGCEGGVITDYARENLEWFNLVFTTIKGYVRMEQILETLLGEKGKRGILRTQSRREAFLSLHCHRIRFSYVPRHCSWLNQIEVFFGILNRDLLRNSSFASVDQMVTEILEYIVQYNKWYARPFEWTYDPSEHRRRKKRNPMDRLPDGIREEWQEIMKAHTGEAEDTASSS